jgi:putative RecB family exonuclease
LIKTTRGKDAAGVSFIPADTDHRKRITMLRPHWSYSQLSQFMRCPLQYFFERILKLPKPFLPSSLVMGSAVHQALAEYHRCLQANQPSSKEQVGTAFLTAWNEAERERPIQYRSGDNRSKLVAQGQALLELYQDQPPPQDILAVEQSMMVPLENSRGQFLEKPLVAVVDLLHREGENLVVNEFKTSGRRFTDSEVDTGLQASAYVHAVQQRYDETARVRYTILLKTKTPAIQSLETIRTDYDLGRLGDIAESIERAIASEAFYPIESPMNCSGCPFFLPCREWKGIFKSEANRNGHIVGEPC